MKTYGYLKANSDTQSRNEELEALVNYGCDEIIVAPAGENLFTMYTFIFNSLKSGDNLVVTDLVSLCKTSDELIELFKKTNQHNITLKSLKDEFLSELELDSNLLQLLTFVMTLD